MFAVGGFGALAGCDDGQGKTDAAVMDAAAQDAADLSAIDGATDAAVADAAVADAAVADAAVADAATTDAAILDAAMVDSAIADAATTDAADSGNSAISPVPGTLTGITVLGGGDDYSDVSTDQGGNVWGVTKTNVRFYKANSQTVYTYDAGSGLAHGRTSWTDPYWFGTPESPSTQPVEFTAVAGGMAGQAFIGNIGYIGDRLQIDPVSGSIRSLEGLSVTSIQQPDPVELEAQQQREVAVWRAALDLNGTYSGATYFGGFHGTSALYNMTKSHTSGECACADYEEHIHPFFLDSGDPLGGDVHAIFITLTGDVWMGDRKGIYFLPQASLGPNADLFQTFDGQNTMIPGLAKTPYLIPFPDAPNGDNWVYGIASDARGGVWVGSLGNGLVYLQPGNYSPTYFSTKNGFPSNYVTDVDIDNKGDVWVATMSDGVVRYHPATGTFTHYTKSSGLPANAVRQLWADRYAASGTAIYFATANGIGVYKEP